MDFYALGFCLVHSRGSWKVCGVSYGAGNIDEEALEMLVNGMRHESKHCSPTGFITELTFYNIKLSVSVAWLKELPWFVLFNLSVLILRQCSLCPKSFELLAEAIVMMPKLHGVDVSFNSNRHGEAVPESFIESLSSLKQLEYLRINDTNIGSHDALKRLTNLIRTSNTLQSLHIGNSSESDLDPSLPVPVLKEVIPSAFATGILKEFGLYNMTIADMVQFSFLLPTNSSITELTLFGEHTRHISCPPPPPVCIQDTNASLSSPNLSLMYRWGDSSAYYERLSSKETIAFLNDVVQQKTYLKLNKVLPSPLMYPLQQMPDRLRGGPQLKLKRAWSLPCLFKYSPIQIPGMDLSRNCSASFC